MRILGIDPGYAIVGYGVVDYSKNHFVTVGYGAITTKAHTPLEDRLLDIYNDVLTVIDKFGPDEISIEKLYFNTNSTTAIAVAEARGVIILAAKQSFYQYASALFCFPLWRTSFERQTELLQGLP